MGTSCSSKKPAIATSKTNDQRLLEFLHRTALAEKKRQEDIEKLLRRHALAEKKHQEDTAEERRQKIEEMKKSVNKWIDTGTSTRHQYPLRFFDNWREATDAATKVSEMTSGNQLKVKREEKTGFFEFSVVKAT